MNANEQLQTNTALREPNGTITPHIACLVTPVLCLSGPHFWGRRHISAGIVLSLAVLAHLNSPFTNDIGVAQPWSLMWVFWLATIERLLFCESGCPETSFWRIDRRPMEAKYMAPWSLAKLRWAAALIFNLRGIRWNWQVKNVLPTDETRRWHFVMRQSLRFFKYLTISDLLLQLAIRLFWTSPDGQVGGMNSKYLTIRHAHWGWSFVNTLVFGFGPYYFINMQYIFASIVAVLFGISKPEDWSPLFGKLSQVTTVRSFWGQFWHQFIRRSVTSVSNWVLDSFAIPRGTVFSRYLQIWIAFGLSGFLHAQANLMLPRPSNVTPDECVRGTMLYFLWQAAAITFEDAVQWAWVKAGGTLHPPSRFRTLIGYAWVVCSFWISLPWAADDMMRMRLMEKSFLPFSFTQNLVRKVPIPPRS
ncbi:uncharacterized protein Z518_00673 [Rhinocladiella mackenziei CBS 650.93]|uniref:Wax synthase domain-containing protein n=1 Tax=Rhinocladiella mackenziei CBS 650.93 TaxID=1442369 RepID=A0A0D2HG29_9EURO|nr:uncharacterized protein Z518_00673 [Rhinocladiella mackenziei CBS 650.93]KIX09593.1 hypothetical protein Z518_00673 [Rhinocladiella mackenziei CBS 650.93]